MWSFNKTKTNSLKPQKRSLNFQGVLEAVGDIAEENSVSHVAVRGGRRRSRWVSSVSWGVNNKYSSGDPDSRPRQSVKMSPDEDAVLLLLIYEHLKVHGHEHAAEVLKEHVKQVRSLLRNAHLPL